MLRVFIFVSGYYGDDCSPSNCTHNQFGTICVDESTLLYCDNYREAEQFSCDYGCNYSMNQCNCKNSCSGEGFCIDQQCICNTGRFGSDCSKSTIIASFQLTIAV